MYYGMKQVEKLIEKEIKNIQKRIDLDVETKEALINTYERELIIIKKMPGSADLSYGMTITELCEKITAETKVIIFFSDKDYRKYLTAIKIMEVIEC